MKKKDSILVKKDALCTVMHVAQNLKVFLIFFIMTRNSTCIKEQININVTTATRSLRTRLN